MYLPTRRPMFSLAAAATALLVCAPAIAQSEGPQPLWELGVAAAGVNQQAYPGAEQQVRRALVLPFFVYRGEVLRADRETAGLRAVKTEHFELDIGFAGSFGGSSADIEARRGMADLGTLIEFGPRAKWLIGPGPGGGRWRMEFPVRGVFDLSDGGAHRGLSFEPELVFERRPSRQWRYAAKASAIFADRRLANTFYGVSAADATADRPAYAAESGRVSWRLSTSLAYAPARDWRVFGAVRLDSVGGAANRASPLVRQTTGASLAVGLAWTGLRSERLAGD